MVFPAVLLGAFGAISLSQSNYTIGAIGVVAGLVVITVSIVAFYRAIGRSQSIPSSIQRQLRRNLFLFGPVVLAQLLIYNYFPNSSFSGLMGPSNEQRA
jgi:uncharacterized membrane protein